MKPRFSFDVDVARHYVKVTMAGLFTPADVAAFTAARDAAHRRLRCGPNAHVTLVDIRAMQIQTQDTVAEFTRLLARRDYASKRIAFVVTQSLARLQLLRAASGRGAGFFADDPDAAEEWLFAAADEHRAA